MVAQKKQTLSQAIKPDSLLIKKVLREIETKLAQAGIASAASESVQILAAAMNTDIGAVRIGSALEKELTAKQLERAQTISAIRATRKPLQLILGHTNFCGVRIELTDGVFIPRPETELLVAYTLEALGHQLDFATSKTLQQNQNQASKPEKKIIELCAGSGAISAALAKNLGPKAKILAIEKDLKAYSCAQHNFRKLDITNVSLLRADIAELAAEAAGLTPEKNVNHLTNMYGRCDAIVTNPPYVPLVTKAQDPEVRDYDPEQALYSGLDGLDLLREIVPLATKLAAPGAYFITEHAENQAAAIKKLLQEAGWVKSQTHQDLTGRERFTSAYWPQQKQ